MKWYLIFIFRPYSAIYTSCMTYEYVGNLARETKHQRKGHIRHVDIFYSPLEVSSSFVPRYNGWSRFLAIGDWWMGWSPQVLVETGGESGSVKGDEEIWWRGHFFGCWKSFKNQKMGRFPDPKNQYWCSDASRQCQSSNYIYFKCVDLRVYHLIETAVNFC